MSLGRFALSVFQRFLSFVYPVSDCSDERDYDKHNGSDNHRQRHVEALLSR